MCERGDVGQMMGGLEFHVLRGDYFPAVDVDAGCGVPVEARVDEKRQRVAVHAVEIFLIAVASGVVAFDHAEKSHEVEADDVFVVFGAVDDEDGFAVDHEASDGHLGKDAGDRVGVIGTSGALARYLSDRPREIGEREVARHVVAPVEEAVGGFDVDCQRVGFDFCPVGVFNCDVDDVGVLGEIDGREGHFAVGVGAVDFGGIAIEEGGYVEVAVVAAFLAFEGERGGEVGGCGGAARASDFKRGGWAVGGCAFTPCHHAVASGLQLNIHRIAGSGEGFAAFGLGEGETAVGVEDVERDGGHLRREGVGVEDVVSVGEGDTIVYRAVALIFEYGVA